MLGIELHLEKRLLKVFLKIKRLRSGRGLTERVQHQQY